MTRKSWQRHQCVSKSFPGVVALHAVDFEICSGEVNALVGENGAGKSTLIKLMAGIYAPDQGNILVGEEHLLAGSDFSTPGRDSYDSPGSQPCARHVRCREHRTRPLANKIWNHLEVRHAQAISRGSGLGCAGAFA